MATGNSNPIFLDKDAIPTDYKIPVNYASTMIYITIKIELNDAAWQFIGGHTIVLAGGNLYPAVSPEPSDLKLRYGGELKDLILAITSRVFKFPKSGTNLAFPIAKYHLIIEAGDILLDEFIISSTANQVSVFDSLIKFS